MKWIGLTGGIASGKSTVAVALRTLGYDVIDADELAHSVTAPGTPGAAAVIAEFGAVIKNQDGSLDRKKLGEIVFGHMDQIKKLEKIVHPLIAQTVAAEKTILKSKGVELAFYDVPLLFEKNLAPTFDDVVLVWCEEDQQRERLAWRNNLSAEQIEARLKSQMPIDQKKKMAAHVIDNSKDLGFLQREIIRVLALLES